MSLPTPSSTVATPPSGRPVGAVYADRGASHYDTLLALMCAVVILSGIGASKGVLFGTIPGTGFQIISDGGFFLFPLAYILGDVVTELYGARAARRAILTAFAMNLLAVASYQVIIWLPGFTDEDGVAKQSALEVALGPVWIVVLAGICGFLAGQSLNSFVMSRMKSRAGERRLIGRLLSSSGLGELVDTIIFCTIAAPAIGIDSVAQWAEYTTLGYVYKVAVQYLAIPLTAAAIGALKRTEPSYQARLRAASEVSAA